MLPHHVVFKLVVCLVLTSCSIDAQCRKAPQGGRLGIVVDERLSVLRATPQFSGRFIRRLSRGKLVAIRGVVRSKDGVAFLLVNVSRRTHGWIQSDAIVSPTRAQDDLRLLTLIKSSKGFDRIVRAKLFIDYFKNSKLRPEVLLLLGDSIEAIAAKLSREAAKKSEGVEANVSSYYFRNYVGLDRYSRHGIEFLFDEKTRSYHYNGAAWRELGRRYPNTREASEALKRLQTIALW